MSTERKEKGLKHLWLEWYVYIISSLLIIITISVILKVKGFWPFGDGVLMNGDFIQEYWPFLREIKRKLLSGDSFLYSWNGGYGTNFFNIVSSFINPFTVIFLLIPDNYVLQSTSIIFMIQEVLINAAMLYYLTHRPKLHLDKHNIANMLFSLSYTLCMYMVSNINNWHMMVCAIIYPFILLGIERFVYNKGWKGYFISLTLCFICNYYMACIFCMFIVLYYLTLEFDSFKVFVHKSWKIFVLSVMAVATAFVSLLPSFIQLFQQSYTISEYTNNTFFTSFFDIFKYFLAFNLPVDRGSASDSYGEVNLYYGLFMLLLTSLYFLCRQVKLSVRLRKLAVVILYLFAFNTDVLNYAMHLFHYPSWFPNRFSLFFTLLCVILAYEAWVTMTQMKFKNVTALHAIGVGSVWLAMAVLCYAFAEQADYKFTYTYSIGLILFYMLAMCLIPVFKQKYATVLSALACIEICVCFAFALIFKSSFSEASYYSELAEGSTDFLDEYVEDEAYGFSRVLETGTVSKTNDAFIYGEKGIAIFTSSINNIGTFLRFMGVEVGGNYYMSYTYSKPLMSLLNVQYIVQSEESEIIYPGNLYTSADEIYQTYEVAASKDGYSIKENDTVLSVGYMIPLEAEQAMLTDTGALEVSEICEWNVDSWVEMVSGISGTIETSSLTLTSVAALNCDVIVQDGQFMMSNGIAQDDVVGLDYEAEDVYYEFNTEKYDASKESALRLDYQAEQAGEYFIQINDKVISTGYLDAGEETHVYYELDAGIFQNYTSVRGGIYISSVNEEQWEKAYEILAQHQLQVSDYTSTTIDGTISVDEDGIMFTSIPYDSNWHVYVDGSEVEVIPLWGGYFVAAKLSSGEHTIHMEYKQSGLGFGALVTIVSLLGMVAVMLVEARGKRCIFLEREDTISEDTESDTESGESEESEE